MSFWIRKCIFLGINIINVAGEDLNQREKTTFNYLFIERLIAYDLKTCVAMHVCYSSYNHDVIILPDPASGFSQANIREDFQIQVLQKVKTTI